MDVRVADEIWSTDSLNFGMTVKFGEKAEGPETDGLLGISVEERLSLLDFPMILGVVSASVDDGIDSSVFPDPSSCVVVSSSKAIDALLTLMESRG